MHKQRWLAWLRIGPVKVTLALGVAFSAYSLVAAWTATNKLTNAEIAAARDISGGSERIDVRFTLRFEPEQFHFGVFQNAGRLVGVEDRDVLVRAIMVPTARQLAGKYWVADVVPLAAP